MGLLMSLAGLLGIEIESLTERVKRTIIFNVVMVLLGVIGLGFLVAAGFFATAEALGAVWAALIFAAGFLLVALVLFTIVKVGNSRRARLAVEKRRSHDTTAIATTAAITALPVMLRSPGLRLLALPAAAIAAYIAVHRLRKPDA
jgi:large-conductance mechanosensitive channel